MNYRSVLEVVKFLRPERVLKIAEVSSLWNSVSVCDELWSQFIEDQDFSTYRKGRSFKSSFLTQHRNSETLVFISDGCLQHFDCKNRIWESPIPLSENWVQFPDASIVVISDGSVVLLGLISHTSSKAVMSVSSKGQVAPLHDSLNIRLKAGATFYNDAVYVFGSMSYGDGKTCEKMELRNSKEMDTCVWTPLPNMRSDRFMFVPSVYNGEIYLIGGWCTQGEIFDPKQETFSQLQCTLPFAYECFSLISDTKICIFTNDWTFIWKKKVKRLKKKRYILSKRVNGMSSVRVFNNGVYVANGNDVYVFDSHRQVKVSRSRQG